MKRFRTMAVLAVAFMLSACLPLARRPMVTDYMKEPPPRQTGQAAGKLTARFLGTSTIVISDGKTTIMTDGFLSRPSLGRLMLLPVSPRFRRIETALNRAKVTHVDAIFVAQSHHDHAMDTPYVAQRTGAKIVGSESTRQVALSVGFPGRIETLRHGSRHDVGKFHVTVFQTPHSKPTPFPGEIAEDLSRRAWVEDYREGGNFSFLVEHPRGRILIVPARGCRIGQFQGVKADVVFLGIGGLGVKEKLMIDYWKEAVEQTGAKSVFPIHWDNFFRELREPLEPVYRRGLRKKWKALEKLAGGGVKLDRPFLWNPLPLATYRMEGPLARVPIEARPVRRCGQRP